MYSFAAVVWIFPVSHFLEGSYGNLALPQTDRSISSWLNTRDVGLPDSLFDISADTTSLEDNLYLYGFSVMDESSGSNLADVDPVAFGSSTMDLFATDPTSNLFSTSESGPELDDSITSTIVDTGLISEDDYCLPNYDRRSRKKRNDLKCLTGQQPQTGTLSLPNLSSEEDKSKPTNFEDEPIIKFDDAYPKKCPNGWPPFGRVFGVACDGPPSLFNLEVKERMIYAYIEKCEWGKPKYWSPNQGNSRD